MSKELLYNKMQEKVQRMCKEWVDYHLTDDIIAGFYGLAKEEIIKEASTNNLNDNLIANDFY